MLGFGFPFFPPEINSFLISSGPGSAPMLEASVSWENLAAELETTAQTIQSLTGGLVAEWTGPSALAMEGAVSPYVAWLHESSIEAADAGARAGAVAAAFEQARTTSIPLAMVLANRVRLLTLVSTNILGQNTGLIAACEAEYQMYWADDVMAMLQYQSASHAARPATERQHPPPTVSRMSTGEETMVAKPSLATEIMPNLSLPEIPGLGSLGDIGTSIPILGDVYSIVSNPASILTTPGMSSASELFNIPARMMTAPVSMLTSLTRGGGTGGTGLGGLGQLGGGGTSSLLDAINEMVSGKLQGLTSGLSNQLSSWGSQIGQQVGAQLANASRIGGLSVPDGAIQTITRALPVPPATTVVSPTTVQAGMPGGPFAQAMMGALAGRGFGGLGSMAKAGAKAAASAKGG
ncbi:PPE family protein [Mycolicibacillus trivialis]|nr:PPE family protein [Mycolicibacillus trivialis]